MHTPTTTIFTQWHPTELNTALSSQPKPLASSLNCNRGIIHPTWWHRSPSRSIPCTISAQTCLWHLVTPSHNLINICSVVVVALYVCVCMSVRMSFFPGLRLVVLFLAWMWKLRRGIAQQFALMLFVCVCQICLFWFILMFCFVLCIH